MGHKLEVRYENKFCYNILTRFDWGDLVDNIVEISEGKPRKIAIVTDSNVAELYLDDINSLLGKKYNDVLTYILPAGEKHKNLNNVQLLYEKLIKNNFYRGDLLIALGGGVVGDLVGYTAATYLRGIDFVQIPTSLLSQVDSSIGGKTGVDFSAYKNMVGAFHMPKLVYININVLNSLPDREFSCGMAEVIKHGIIRDRAYFDSLVNNSEKIISKDMTSLEDMVYKSCKIKRDVVEIDPKETGLRAILNFGHTIGHAIEKECDFSLSHGQCVALGSISALMISNRLKLIDNSDVKMACDIFNTYGLSLKTSVKSVDDIFTATKSDKKMTSSGIKFILAKSIGEAFIYKDLSDEDIMFGIKGVVHA